MSGDDIGMKQKLLEAIDMAVASGVPTSMLGDVLTSQGWPAEIVNETVEQWLQTHHEESQRSGFRVWLEKYHKKARPAVVVVVLIGMVQAGIALLKPWPTKILADSAFGDIPAWGPLEPYTHTPTLILITALMSIALFVLGAAFDFFSDFILLKIGFWLNRSIKQESLRHILHLPLFHQERLAKGDYVYRQNVVTNSLSDLVLGTTSAIIGSIIMIIGVLAIMISFNPKLTLVSVVLMPLLYLTMRIFGPKLGFYNQQLTEVASDTAASINESVDNAETVQAFTLEDKQINKIDRLWMRSYYLTKKTMMWGNLLQDANSFLVIIATSIVMYFGGTAALNGQLTFGELLIFMTYMGYLLGPIEGLVQEITSRNQKLIDVGRVYEVISDHQGIEDLRRDAHVPPNIKGVIDFRDVSYTYGSQTIFNNLNLHIKEGEKVGVIGPSGSGKSTILKLMPLFIEPNQGKIFIDGIDTQSVSLHELRQKIAWVSQSPQLFTGTILDNLYDGDAYHEISDERVKDAIIVSNVAEFAVRLPLGINSPAGENGSSLSGGQRQRVAIARALIKDAPIVCLDEPTAALDAKSENYIRDSLMQMVQGKTVLMVTHRKALLALMDTIYVLDSGTLTNVNELGGLDYYLSVLEGLDQKNVEAEIQDEQAYIDPAILDKFLALQAAEQRNDVIEQPEQLAEAPQIIEYVGQPTADQAVISGETEQHYVAQQQINEPRQAEYVESQNMINNEQRSYQQALPQQEQVIENQQPPEPEESQEIEVKLH
jgi:ABC-type bacteriocin/lantibiotic exporter with double-glycine peptidase domain